MSSEYRDMTLLEVFDVVMRARKNDQPAQFHGYVPYALLEDEGFIQPYAAFAVYEGEHQFLYVREKRNLLHSLSADEYLAADKVLTPTTRWDWLRIDDAVRDAAADFVLRHRPMDI